MNFFYKILALTFLIGSNCLAHEINPQNIFDDAETISTSIAPK